MFIGDFIFKESIGRCDLPGGSEDDMLESINRIKKFFIGTLKYFKTFSFGFLNLLKP